MREGEGQTHTKQKGLCPALRSNAKRTPKAFSTPNINAFSTQGIKGQTKDLLQVRWRRARPHKKQQKEFSMFAGHKNSHPGRNIPSLVLSVHMLHTKGL